MLFFFVRQSLNRLPVYLSCLVLNLMYCPLPQVLDVILPISLRPPPTPRDRRRFYVTSQGAWPRAGYFLVSHAVSGILHVQITLSHFSMDVTEKPQYR